jgi:amidase
MKIAIRLLCVIAAAAGLHKPLLAASPADHFDLETATIADVEAAMGKGIITSEKLTELYLKRIETYDKQGPAVNALITLNPHALDVARERDAERKAGKIRGPLHGIPIVLKDNFNTFDLPTTAGSQLLAGSIPPTDAFIVKKLRDAGAIIIGKANMSEFAGSGGNVAGTNDAVVKKAGRIPSGSSSMGGQTRNPYDLLRCPDGSSGGPAVAVAACFAQFALGTDTGGSVRGPCMVTGIAGLKPTNGLLSRSGIVPLALTLDTAGPMARNIYDIAVALNVIAGSDPADPVTATSKGKIQNDYTQALVIGALRGARIGVARDLMGQNPETDQIVGEAIASLKKCGAVVIDPIDIPRYVLQSQWGIYNLIVSSEFKAQIGDYLRTLGPGYPKSLEDLVALSNDPNTEYRAPGKAVGFKYTESVALDLHDPVYLAAKNEGLAATKAAILAVFAKYHLDTIIYPTKPGPAVLIVSSPSVKEDWGSNLNLANQTGFPDLAVPAGMTSSGLPVTLSFLGKAFDDAKILGYGYDFEQATRAYRIPKYTPALPSDSF